MTDYMTMQHVTAEFRSGAAVDVDALMRQQARDYVIGQGLTPAGEPRLRWGQITPANAEAYRSLFSMESVSAGDWYVRALTPVAEAVPPGCPECGASGDGGHGGGCRNSHIRYPGPNRGGRGLAGHSAVTPPT